MLNYEYGRLLSNAHYIINIVRYYLAWADIRTRLPSTKHRRKVNIQSKIYIF